MSKSLFRGLICFGLLMPSVSKGKISSLMFNAEQVRDIELERHKNRIQDHSCLTCTGYVFINQDSWSLWLNRKRFTKKELADHKLLVFDVSTEGVLIKTDNDKQILIRPGVTLSATGEG